MDASNSKIDISVVVPVYNVEEYLIECLDSINNQTKDNLQVIIIDDGSPDRCGEMADAYCKTHPNFECHHIENGGLGHARNYALQFAKGKYIAYMDSDDIIAPDMYQTMFEAAERNNSDMTSCNVIRFNSKGIYSSKLHINALNPITQEVTHITKDHSLLFDTIACNKLIRVDFLKKHTIQFPENILYEDIPTTIPMHCLANNVSIVKTTAYYWRMRDGANTSITQNISNSKNLHDRITVMTMNNQFLKDHDIDPTLVRSKLIKDVEFDLNIFINNCKFVTDDVAYDVFQCINEYVAKFINDDIFSAVNLFVRQKYEYIKNNDLEGLRNLLYQQSNYYNAPVTEKDGRFYIDCSNDLFSVPDRDITEDIKKTHPKQYINVFSANAKTAKLDAHLYIPRVNIASPEEQTIKAFLLNDHTQKKLPLELVRLDYFDLTEKKGVVFDEVSGKKTNYNYNGTGYKILFAPGETNVSDQNIGTNHILIEYENRVKKGAIILGNTSAGQKEKINGTVILANNQKFVFAVNDREEVIVTVKKLSTHIQSIQANKEMLTVTLADAVKSVYLEPSNGEKLFATHLEQNSYSFALSEILLDASYAFYCIDATGKPCALYNIDQKSIVKKTAFGTLLISPIKDNNPELVLTQFLGMVSSAKKQTHKHTLSITTNIYGKKCDMKGLEKVVLGFEDDITKQFFVLGQTKGAINKGKISAVFDLNFSRRARTQNLHSCLERLYVELIFKEKESLRLPLYAKKKFNVKTLADCHWIRFFNHNKNQAAINVWQIWPEAENTPAKRKALLEEKYTEYRKLPIKKNRIVFESMQGKEYNCNPQAIYEYIDRHYPEYECIWAFDDAHHPITGNAKRVRRGSLKYYYYLATTKYLVNNVNFPDEYVKREGQIEVQTMHGSPLKTFGLEIPGELPAQKDRERFIKKSARWDYLVVQGTFTANKSLDCFGVKTEIMHTGYPRTDVLYAASSQKIEAIKQKLNIPQDIKVVLYAPTWRIRNVFDMQLDIEKFRQELGDDYVLLVKIHPFSANGFTVPTDDKYVFDMKNYASIEDLYLITDIFITDYSSALFDFVLTGKPMIFYLYDIKEYTENLRGMYFDIEKEAPGPLAYDNDQLIHAIKNIDKAMDECSDRIKEFYNTYVNYECENSSQKVVEILLKERNTAKNKVLRSLARAKRFLKH